MKSYMSIVLLVFILHGQSRAQWQNMNLPSNVRVNSLAVRDSELFAATDGKGIFVSTDNGESWNSVNTGLQSEIVHAILINGTKVFAGTDTGAFVSTDDGSTWNTIDSSLSGIGVWSFATGDSITGDSILFAGTWSGVFVSTDYGESWAPTNLSHTSMPVRSLSVLGHSVFAATLGGGVFYSSYNGSDWKDISIMYTDTLYPGSEALVPVYSLAILDTTLVAGAGSGYIYFTQVDSPVFETSHSSRSGKNPFVCFAAHDTEVFAGSLSGYIYLSIGDPGRWDILAPVLVKQSVYSLALNDSYIFAGTAGGVWRLRYPEPVTDVNTDAEHPNGFVLEQNYPNPFNPSTVISYQLSAVSNVSLKVYDVLGRSVATLVNERQTAGAHSVTFHAGSLPSGVYFYSLVTNGFRETKKLILLK